MQPARLGAALGCLAASGLLASMLLVPSCHAQTSSTQPVLETPQQVNDRIRQLSAGLRMGPHDYIIGPGDVLDIQVFDVKELSREVRVSQTGTIGIPLVPVRLRVAGLTEMQAEQKIAEVLESDGLVTHADVSVSVKDHKSKPITVVGAVPHPMVYEADRSVTLLEVLADAGGVSSDAGDTVIVTRPVPDPSTDEAEPPEAGAEPVAAAPAGNATSAKGSASSGTSSAAVSSAPSNSSAQAEPPPLANTITVNLNDLMETGDTKNNITLQAGDIVTVPHAGIVYVLGAVNRSGGYVMANDRSQLTTLKILALAGGLTRTAKSDHAVIVRKDSQGQQHEVAVDLKKVLNRQAEDIQLQPSDILYVPQSGSKQALYRSLELGIALGSAVALYRIAYQ
ncbi:MAG TPA: polysaccharide biosynthesis/export family protein [Terriglobales bacterium]|nr:polysaccharide biosynthesis/export family protein [Terriglobales bacterium]